MLEPVDQQAAKIIRRGIDRAHNLVTTEVAKPFRRRLEKCVRNFLIVDRLEHSETADVRAVELIILRVVTGGDTTDEFAVTTGDKKFRLAVFEKRMLLAIEK